MPRAPHSSALLAGRPRAKRAVLASSVSRMRSMPLSSASGTRLTVLTGRKALRLGLPDKGIACGEIGPLGLARTEPLDGPGDPLEKAGKGFLKVHVGRPLQRRARQL